MEFYGLCTVLLFLFPTTFFYFTQASLVPGLYIFGDSLVDAGNNNYLNTPVRANKPPYGIDFPGGATGRFTNGYTVPDFFAEWMSLPLVPPILQCNHHGCRQKLKGFNFGSASSGILPETGSANGEILFLSRQIDLFADAVQKYLKPGLRNPVALSRHLENSIFLFCSGSNDFGLNYFRQNETTRPKPEKFAETLCNFLSEKLRFVHRLGGRKFLVFGVPAVRCPPDVACTGDTSTASSVYNARLEGRLKELTYTLQNSTIVLANLSKLAETVTDDPLRFGFKDITHPCVKDHIPCPNRNQYLLWDVHPTQAAYKIFAMEIFNGSGYTIPFNVLQLIKA